jgi:hypothetical protein
VRDHSGGQKRGQVSTGGSLMVRLVRQHPEATEDILMSRWAGGGVIMVNLAPLALGSACGAGFWP